MEDTVVTCIQCGSKFVLSRSELERCETKGFETSKRCPECKRRKIKSDDMYEERKQHRKKKHFRDKYGL